MATDAQAGDRIVVNSDKAGVPARQGEILDVIPHENRVEFRVRWDDGHVSEIRPTGASYQIQSKASAGRR
jgi:transcription-repair coupling factor (superfamily II helicase)